MKHWPKLGEITERITNRLAPVQFIVDIDGPLAVALVRHAMDTECEAETVIREAVRAYLGEQ